MIRALLRAARMAPGSREDAARQRAQKDVLLAAFLALSTSLSRWRAYGADTMPIATVRDALEGAVARLDGMRAGWAFRDREFDYDREPGAGLPMTRDVRGYRSVPTDVDAHCFECGAPEGRDCSPHCTLWE